MRHFHRFLHYIDNIRLLKQLSDNQLEKLNKMKIFQKKYKNQVENLNNYYIYYINF